LALFGAFLAGGLSNLLPRAQALDSFHAGFLFDRHSQVFETGEETQVVGPFYYYRTNELDSTWALPPFYSNAEWLEGVGQEYDILYPLLSFDRYGNEYRWHFCQLLSFAGGDNQEEVSRHRFSLFPFYFQQRSEDTNYNYTALFPLVGHLENRIFRSEIDFVLWPLYVKSVKRPSAGPPGDDQFQRITYQWFAARRGDVTTYNYLYPFFHIRYGDGLFGWQFWPLVGDEKKELTTKTNNWGEVEQYPGHRKWFVAWPIYLQQERNLGTANPEHELMIFPLYNRLRSPGRDSTSYLTPFGLTITDDRTRKYREVDAPWPFIVFAWGEGKTTKRIWPLFSHAATKELESDFYLWPLYTHKRIRGETLDRNRWRLLYFLYSRSKDLNTETGFSRTRTDFWPLFTHQKMFDGRTRLQILAPLEPILPTSKSIERNYSPLWSLWRSEHDPKSGSSSHSLLWNLYRREVTPESKKGSLLFGLFQYESSAEAHHWRVFYLPWKAAHDDPEHVSEYR